MTAEQIFDSKARFNKWLKELTPDEKSLVIEMIDEARSYATSLPQTSSPRYTATMKDTIGKILRARKV